MIYIEVALKIPINTVFTYSYEPKEGDGAEQLPEIGKRVSVRFGNQNLTGFVVSKGEKISETTFAVRMSMRLFIFVRVSTLT